mgnify:CR=1 FL=1
MRKQKLQPNTMALVKKMIEVIYGTSDVDVDTYLEDAKQNFCICNSDLRKVGMFHDGTLAVYENVADAVDDIDNGLGYNKVITEYDAIMMLNEVESEQ